MSFSYLHFFPYTTFRNQQQEIITNLEQALEEGSNCLVVAPNGTGKTIIALSSVLSVAKRLGKKILYTCRTHSQSNRVIEELKKIHAHSPHAVLGISLLGRNETCLHPHLSKLRLPPHEAMTFCKNLRRIQRCSYYKNYKEIKKEIPITHPSLLAEPLYFQDVLSFCKRHSYCPYFLLKELMKSMDVIVLNFRWVFDPLIRFRLFQQLKIDLSDCLLIIDECHNLLQLAAEINSARLLPSFLLKAMKDPLFSSKKTFLSKFQSFLKAMMAIFQENMKNLPLGDTAIDPIKFLHYLLTKSRISHVQEFKTILENIQNENNKYKENILEQSFLHDPTSPLAFKKDLLTPIIEFWKQYLRVMEKNSYFFCFNVFPAQNLYRKSVSLEICALDPRDGTYYIFKNVYGSISLTGTVHPKVYRFLTGMNFIKNKLYKEYMLPSPFNRQHFLALITEGVDTANEHRSSSIYEKIIEKLSEVIKHTPKNVGIFCASYNVLNDLLDHGLENKIHYTQKKLFIEKQNAPSSENANLIKQFKSYGKNHYKGAVLLGVCGGRNSEGEDFPGNTMNAVAIVGIPYEHLSPRVKARVEYYDKQFNKTGWVFGYLAPAMQKANQAAGRVIRTLKDRGIIVFMDSRFKQHASWISSWIHPNLFIVKDIPGVLASKIHSFWTITS